MAGGERLLFRAQRDAGILDQMNEFVMFTPTWGKTIGGTSKVARGLVYGIKNLIPSCKFYIISPDTDKSPEQDIEYIDGKILSSSLLFAFFSLLRIRPSVIHCQGRVHQLFVGFVYKTLVDRNVKLLCSFYTQPTTKAFLPGGVEGIPDRNRLTEKIKNCISVFLLNRADSVIANSASLAENLCAVLGPGFKRQFIVIPSGVDQADPTAEEVESFVHAYNLNAAHPIFLTVGVFSWDWKVSGILLLLDTFREVISQFPSSRLVIVGDGRYRYLVESKIKTLSLQEHVVLTGNLLNTFVPVAVADIYCHLALNESCSVSIIEAMISGKPVIVARAGGNPEVIDDENTGLVVEPVMRSVKTAMIRLAKDMELSDKLGKAAKSVAPVRYGWPAIARQYAFLYSGNHALQLVTPKGSLLQ